MNELTLIVTPNGNGTSFAYDSENRVTQIQRGLDSSGSCPSGAVCPTTSYAYQSPGASCPSSAVGQTVVTDPDGNATTDCYDRQARVVRTIDPDGHQQTTDYANDDGGSDCADNNPCSTTDALGKTTTFGYFGSSSSAGLDILEGENLNWRQSPLEGTTNRPSLYYDDSGHPALATQYTDPQFVSGGPSHSWLYSYDAAGDLASKSEGSSGAGQNPVTFTHNSDGTLATATDAKGNETKYCYDAAQDCSGATTHQLTAIIPPAPLGKVTVTYDSLHRISTVTDGKGQTRTYGYDLDDRVVKIAYSGGPTLTFGYDQDGNVKTVGVRVPDTFPRERVVLGELHLLRTRLDELLGEVATVIERSTQPEEGWLAVEEAARLARRALSAAVSAVPAPSAAVVQPGELRVGELRVDPVSRRQWYGEAEFELTPLHHRLLAVMAADPFRVFGKDELAAAVWGSRGVDRSNAVKMAVGRVRRALVLAGALRGEWMLSVYGVGWALARPA